MDMVQATSFESTYSVWNSNYQKPLEDEGAFEMLNALEMSLLRHVPTTVDEVICLLRLVRLSIETGGRADSLDIVAFDNIIAVIPRILPFDAVQAQPAATAHAA